MQVNATPDFRWNPFDLGSENTHCRILSACSVLPQVSSQVMSLLFSLCRELNRIGGHALDRYDGHGWGPAKRRLSRVSAKVARNWSERYGGAFHWTTTIIVKSSWNDGDWIWIHELLFSLNVTITVRLAMMPPSPCINVGVSFCPLRTMCSWYFKIDSGKLVSSQNFWPCDCSLSALEKDKNRVQSRYQANDSSKTRESLVSDTLSHRCLFVHVPFICLFVCLFVCLFPAPGVCSRNSPATYPLECCLLTTDCSKLAHLTCHRTELCSSCSTWSFSPPFLLEEPIIRRWDYHLTTHYNT